MSSAPPSSFLSVVCQSEHPVLCFAAEELVRYLGLMAGRGDAARIVSDAGETGALEIGLFSELGQDPFPELDLFWDDAISIQVSDSVGIITGLNPRSALHAVYRFLESAGCRWLRPGPDGDFIPLREITDLSAAITEKPSFRYRGNSHCGGYHEAVLEKIDWMAKVGLNICFEEFFPPNRRSGYYLRRYPSLLPAQNLPHEKHQNYFAEELAALKKRGILFQSVGHGWTGALYDLYRVESPDDRAEFFRRASEQPEYLAEVNGERRPHRRGGALYTELCYGNPEVREKLIRATVDYAAAHPEVDFLQFSMSDAMNLMCECPLCRDTAPSDFLVELLNGIDAGLSTLGMQTRIGFFLYQEIWWPPVAAALRNPSRFLIYFCPIARDYQTPYAPPAPGDSPTALPPFVYNRNERLSSLPVLIDSLLHWQKAAPGAESIAFEYHLTWYHYFDPGQFNLARLMTEDIRRMPQLGLSGFVSCQTVRASFPTGLLLALHARCLWKAEEDVDTFAADYFRAAFGEDGPLVIRYLQSVSNHFRPGCFYRYFPLKETPRDDEAISSLSRIPALVESFRPIVEENLKYPVAKNPVHHASWSYLFAHLRLVPLLADCMRVKLEGNQPATDAYWDQILDFLLINEKRLHAVLDHQWFYEAHLRRANLFSPSFVSSGGFEQRDVLNVSAQLQDPRD